MVSSDEEGWGGVVKLPSSGEKRKAPLSPNKPSGKKYECKHGSQCKSQEDTKHTSKYFHTDSSQPPKKRMRQQKISHLYSQDSFALPSSQDEAKSQPENELDDDKTLEMSTLPDFPPSPDEDEGFNLEREEILLLSEKSESGEFSCDESNQQISPPPPLVVSSKLPDNYTDHWNSKYVKLPCSPKNTYRRKNKPNRYLSRWYLIQSVFASSTIQSAKELEESIRSYLSSNCSHWDFSGMRAFFRDSLTASERKHFFTTTLPHIIHIALSMPKLFPDGIPMLVGQKEQEITLSQSQLACLLANGLLCTFPSQQGKPTREEKESGETTERFSYQHFNFNGLFQGFGGMILESQAAKLICLLTYFDRIIREPPTHNVTFYRKYIPEENSVKWRLSGDLLTEIEVHDDGFIEDQTDSLQVDFANKMIGGGVLGTGCVQEEIRFMLSPELLCSLLFTAELGDTECLIIKGSERFSNYTGYGNTFDFGGPYYECAPVDAQNRLETYVVAIDALYVGGNKKKQYTYNNVKRELNKAFCGFEKNPLESTLIPIATGNWGCGVFGGHFMLKFLIQLMAASLAGRKMKYFTFATPGLQEKITQLHNFLKCNRVTVGQLYKALLVFCRVVQNKKITNDDTPESQELCKKCAKFAKENPPDLTGFLMYYFQLSQSNPQESDQEEEPNGNDSPLPDTVESSVIDVENEDAPSLEGNEIHPDTETNNSPKMKNTDSIDHESTTNLPTADPAQTTETENENSE